MIKNGYTFGFPYSTMEGTKFKTDMESLGFYVQSDNHNDKTDQWSDYYAYLDWFQLDGSTESAKRYGLSMLNYIEKMGYPIEVFTISNDYGFYFTEETDHQILAETPQETVIDTVEESGL